MNELEKASGWCNFRKSYSQTFDDTHTHKVESQNPYDIMNVLRNTDNNNNNK